MCPLQQLYLEIPVPVHRISCPQGQTEGCCAWKNQGQMTPKSLFCFTARQVRAAEFSCPVVGQNDTQCERESKIQIPGGGRCKSACENRRNRQHESKSTSQYQSKR